MCLNLIQLCFRHFRWHRLGISVLGDTVTLIYDCSENMTLPFNRSKSPELDIDGVVFIARQLLEDDIFLVSICNSNILRQ